MRIFNYGRRLHQVFRRKSEVRLRKHRWLSTTYIVPYCQIVNDGVYGLLRRRRPANHHGIADKVLHAGSNPYVPAERNVRSAASIRDGDGLFVAWRLLTGVTETRDHHTAAEEAVARRRRDEELSTSLESNVYLLKSSRGSSPTRSCDISRHTTYYHAFSQRIAGTIRQRRRSCASCPISTPPPIVKKWRCSACLTSVRPSTQISVCKSPFPSAGIAVSLFRAKTVQQRPLLPREVETRLPDCGVTH